MRRGRCTSSAPPAAGCPRARRCSRACTPAIGCPRRRSRRCSITCARPGRGWSRSTCEPLAVLDGMSQTATVVGGFAEDPVVRAYTEGEFADTLIENEDSAIGETWAAAEYASTLRQLVPGLPHVTFVASGAEANEKAMALCRINCARKRRDQGARLRGQLPRPHAARRSTRPTRRASARRSRSPATSASSRRSRCGAQRRGRRTEEPAAPSGFYAAAATGGIDELRERFGDAKDDPLLAAEVASLAAVHDALASGEYACVIVEPMQSEGGDRYATERFFRALRLLTRHHQTFLVFDEVQVGFGLGGPFAWHSKFRLLNSRGQPDYPDAVTFAKRAQVGVVMSRFADPEPATAHGASLVRGRIHADMVSTSHNAERLEKLVQPRLAQIARAYPHLVQQPARLGLRVRVRSPDAGPARCLHRPAVLARRHRVRRGHADRALSPERQLPGARDRHAVRDDPALAVVARRARGQEAAGVGGCPGRATGAGADRDRTGRGRVSRRPARRGDDPPAGDPRHRVPGLRAGAPDAAGRDPRRDRGRRGVADRRRGAVAGRQRRDAAGRVRDRRAARAVARRRGAGRRSDARQAQHDVLGVDHRRAELPELGHRATAQGAAAARRRSRAGRPTACRAIATSPAATASGAPRR